MSELEEIRRGIAAYAIEQEVLKRLIKRHGILFADDFDRIFYTRDASFPRPLSKTGIGGDTWLLGGMSPFKSRNWWLDLLQHMIVIGDVQCCVERTIDDDGAHDRIMYQLPVLTTEDHSSAVDTPQHEERV